MPTYKYEDLGLTKEQAQAMFSGLSKEQAIKQAQDLYTSTQKKKQEEMDKSNPTEMGIQAGQEAQSILNEFDSGKGKLAVGKSAPIGWLAGVIPGTETGDFKKRVDMLKGKLSVDASRYLKGQGQMSDAERELLKNAVSDLQYSQSEEAFKNSLKQIIDKLSPKKNKTENQNNQPVTSGITSTGIKFTVQ